MRYNQPSYELGLYYGDGRAKILPTSLLREPEIEWSQQLQWHRGVPMVPIRFRMRQEDLLCWAVIGRINPSAADFHPPLLRYSLHARYSVLLVRQGWDSSTLEFSWQVPLGFAHYSQYIPMG